MSGHELDTFLNQELIGTSDRAAIIVATAYLDDLLLRLLEHTLPVSADKPSADHLLRGPGAPLGGFSARILASHRLGLIGDQLRDALTFLRKLRNEFAHQHERIDLSQPTFKKLMDGIRKLIEGSTLKLILQSSVAPKLGATTEESQMARFVAAICAAQIHKAILYGSVQTTGGHDLGLVSAS